MLPLDPTDLLDLYWAGRTTLVSRRDDIAVYDRVFRQFFLADGAPAASLLMLSAGAAAEAEAALVMPGTEPGEQEDEEKPVLGWMASDVDALKHRSFAACTPCRACRFAPDHGQDPAHPAAAANPPDAPSPVRAAFRTCAGPSGNPCGCMASRPSCSSASAGRGCDR